MNGVGTTGMESRSTRNGPNPGSKALGTVWVLCPYPILLRGLAGVLKADARVRVGHQPPQDQAPSSIIFCPNEGEHIASEVKRLRQMFPRAPVLVFGLRLDPRVGGVAFRSGASGYLHAAVQPAQIVEALSLACGGEVVIPKEILKDLVEAEIPRGTTALTPRQREILALVAEGQTNAEIARRLYLSEFTIKQHLRLAFEALKVKNRTEAAKLWSGLEEAANS